MEEEDVDDAITAGGAFASDEPAAVKGKPAGRPAVQSKTALAPRVRATFRPLDVCVCSVLTYGGITRLQLNTALTQAKSSQTVQLDVSSALYLLEDMHGKLCRCFSGAREVKPNPFGNHSGKSLSSSSLCALN